jgi:putative heme uptake system protein
MAGPAQRETILLVDGENIDATLGGSLLGRRPAPEERPRWDRVREYARAVWDQPVRGLFFLNASGQIPMAFVQALTALDFRPVLLSGPSDVKVVDVAIVRTIEALAERGHGDVMLASHDGDFAPAVATLLDAPGRRVGVIGFRELVSSQLADLASGAGASAGASGAGAGGAGATTNGRLELFDLEDDVGAFTVALPRIRVIPIERFDPWTLLS